MKRILAVFSLFALACIPASAYTWPVSTYLNPLALPSNFTGVPGTGYSCTYAAYTGGGNNVVQTNYTSGGYTQSEYLWANGPVSGDTGPKGGYFQLNFSTYGLTLYANGTSGLTTIASSSASVGSGATVMMVTGPPTWISSSYVVEVGVFVNGVNVIDLQNTPLYGISETAFVPCSGQVNLANTYATPTAPTGLGYSSATNYVDLSWTAATDPSGLGVWEYRIFRSDQTAAIGSTTSLTYSDTTVLPGTQYTYTVAAVNQFLSTTGANITARSVGISSNPPYPSATPEGRRVGVRPTGTYWGATGENIDVRSGNLNFAFPILTAIGRTGWSVPFNLVYNSQNWRKDSGGNWKFDGDIGYGFGWRLTAGTIIPVWSTGGITATYYLYVDSSGAEYRLSSNTGNVWSSPESVYVWFDANTNILHFRDGTYWYFGSTSAPGEADAGTLSPTMMSDTNANQISVLYFAGSGMTWSGYNNSSSRIGTITDVRAPSGSYTYSASPGYVTSNIGDGLNWTFTELTGQSLVEPFGGTSFGTTSFLSSVSTATGTTSFTYDSSGELTKVTLPKGGYLKYDYGTVAYSNGKSFREVTNRYLSKDGTVGSQTTYAFSHPTAAGADVESSTQINDPGGVGQKKWAFFTTGTYEGLTNNYYGNDLTAGATKTENDFTWAQDMSGNSYISSATSILDPGQSYAATKMTNQTVDIYGNVTQVQNYDYGNLSTPKRTYNYTYAYSAVTPYQSLYIYNRLAQATETEGTTLTLATNVYDYNYCNSYPSYCKGNLTSTVTPSGTTTLGYDSYGNVNGTTVNGVTSSSTYPSSTNYAAPTQLTVGSLTQTMTYSSFLGLSSQTNPNGATASITYDTSARPATTTGIYGAVTNYTYSTGPYTSTAPFQTTATVNGRFTRTTVDGLSRTILTEHGTVSGSTYTTVSQAETAYASCGCSPLGKMSETSLPHAPTSGPAWNTYYYDGIGRTVETLKADWVSATTYLYQGNTVTVTDPASKWKTYTSDAFGRLTQVTEPNPAGGSNYVTTYTYDLLDHLIGVSMPRPSGTQTRTFNYGTSPTTPFLQSATNPENGTVSYTYDSQNRLSTVTDAKSQRKVMTYDSLNRVTMIQRGSWSGSTFTEDTKQRTTFTYGTASPSNGLLTSVKYMAGKCAGATQTGTDQNGNPLYWNTNCALAVESYGYGTNGAGEMTAKSLQITRNATSTTTVTGTLSAYWSYDNEGRVTGELYPSWNTCATCTNQGSSYTYAYDTMGRLNTMTNALNSASLVSGVTYGVANEIQQITSANQALIYTETRSYNALFQLTQLAEWGTAGAVLDRGFTYPTGQNTGKIGSETDVLSGEIVAYTYDALNRLATAQTTQVGGTQWGQSYTYDGFGNLTDQTVTAGSAPSMHVTYNPANNLQTAPVADVADANGNILGSATQPNVFDIDNRMIQPGSGSTMAYSYDARNKRIWRGNPSASLDELDFWSGNQKLATYQISSDSSSVYFNLKGTNVYFGGKLVSKGTCSCTGAIVYTTSTSDALTLAPMAADRLGSIGNFYPFGQEKPSATANDTEKFTGYFRDQATGLDYADQRYHQSGVGRFLTPDRYAGSAHGTSPGSLNRYVYVGGDPVNRRDRTGRDYFCNDDESCGGGGASGQGQCGAGNADLIECQPANGGDTSTCPAGAGDPSFLPDPLAALEPGCGGGAPGSSTDSTAPPPVVECTLTLFERPLDNPIGAFLGGVHSYLLFESDTYSGIIQGDNVSGTLLASTNTWPPNVGSDNPSADTDLGSITGPDVCDWLSLLAGGSARINAANISYPRAGLGANSNSVARYLTSLLPNSGWFTVPFELSFSGWYSLLPGVETAKRPTVPPIRGPLRSPGKRRSL